MKKYASRVQPRQTGLYSSVLRGLRRTLAGATLLTFVTATSACAARTPAAVSFDAIKRDEAQLARGAAAIDQAPSCDAAQAGAERVCAARRDLCQRVRESADEDAQMRCMRAMDMCSAARARANATCTEREGDSGL